MNELARALELLDDATAPADRLAAMALALSYLAPDGELARLLAHRGHLIARGGSRALLREALARPEGAALRTQAEALASTRAGRAVHLIRRASTRPDDDGRVRVIETGGTNAGGVQFSADGTFLYTFVWGSQPWLDADDDHYYSRFQQWRTDTGELVRQAQVGQFREESGSFAVSPDDRTLAVRAHREIQIYDLHDWDGRGRPRLRFTLSGCEGPYQITFLDEVRLLADDSSRELVLWDTASGQRISAAPSIGWHAHVVAAGGTRLIVAGCLMNPGRMLGTHALPSLAMDGCFAHRAEGETARARSEAIDLSPSQQWIATGDDQRAVMLWRLRDLQDPAGTSGPRTPLAVEARKLGEHHARVSAVRFVGEQRLLSGSWGGGVLDWQLPSDGSPDGSSDDPAAPPPRLLIGHSACISAIAVHPRSPIAASSAEDGRVVLWDLAGSGGSLPRVIPPARTSRELRPHPDGLEVINDGVSAIIIPLPPQLALDGLPPPQDPELIGINLGQLGELELCPVDDPGPPQLRLLRNSELLDVLELEDHHGGLCALDARTVAVIVEGHVDFYQLR